MGLERGDVGRPLSSVSQAGKKRVQDNGIVSSISSSDQVSHLPRDSSGQFKSSWKAGDLVKVKVDGTHWENGKIYSVKKNCEVDGQATPLAITITCTDPNSKEDYFAKTWSPTCDEIPNKLINTYVCGRDMRYEYFDSISIRESNMYRLLKQFAKRLWKDKKMEQCFDETENHNVDIMCVIPVGESIDGFLESVSKMSQYESCLTQSGIKDKSTSMLNIFAFIVGTSIAVELQSMEANDVQKNFNSLDQLPDLIPGNHQTLFKDINCQVLQVFLSALVGSRINKACSNDPKRSFLDSCASNVLSLDPDSDEYKDKSRKLLMLVALMHAAGYQRTPSTGPASAMYATGVELYLDPNAPSESTFDNLFKNGITPRTKTIREVIDRMTSALDTRELRMMTENIHKPGHQPILLHTGDNADSRFFARTHSVIQVGDIHVGNCVDETDDYFNKHFISKLPAPKESHFNIILPTKEDDEVAQRIITVQNIEAIIMAFLSSEEDYVNSGPSSTNPATSNSIKADSQVTFDYRNKERRGIVKTVNNDVITVQFNEGNGELEEVVLNQDNVFLVNPNGEEGSDNETTSTNGDASASIHFEFENEDDRSVWTLFESIFSHYVPGTIEGSRNCNEFKSTTLIYDVIEDLSSKNATSAIALLNRIIAKLGKDRFKGTVTMVSADQEFMPTIYAEFFKRLHSNNKDNRYALLLPLAMGHAMKNNAMSIISYYKAMFDPVFIAQGIKIDSPEYKRICNGRVIRDLNNWIVNATETALSDEHRGLYPNTSVYCQDLILVTKATSTNHLDTLLKDASKQWKGVELAKQRRAIFETTICSVTDFKPKGGGFPQLLSNTANVVSTGSVKNDLKKTPLCTCYLP